MVGLSGKKITQPMESTSTFGSSMPREEITLATMEFFLSSNDICYKYSVMTQVCVLVKFRNDPEKNTYSWLYTGGCFKNNDPVNYEEIKPGDVRTFKDV